MNPNELAVLFGVIALLTCFFNGRQWPTCIAATCFGIFLGGGTFAVAASKIGPMLSTIGGIFG